MAFSDRFQTRRDESEEEDFDENGESDIDYVSDDSDFDPSYSILEETNAKFSKLSVEKKSKPSKVVDLELSGEGDIDDVFPVVSIADENDEDDIDEVLKIIKAGKLEKLKVEQCKVYLRKNGLRLTGNKDTLIKRINQHLEILNGGGEKKYLESSFTINCKGDACTGDVVMFEQKVYEMYNIASRSSIGPSCGTRIVAGRIVKESYGASKQQHTFSIEVLWSKGEKPLPPLHPLLIKGRNLYRLKTLRQSWEDEGKRQKVLMEKHSRGSVARSDRGARVLEKEKRKIPQKNRISRKESCSDNSSQSNPTSAGIASASAPTSTKNLFVDSRNLPFQHQPPPFVSSGNFLQPRQSENQAKHVMDALRNNYWNQVSRNIYGNNSLNRGMHINQGVHPQMHINHGVHPQMQVTPRENYYRQSNTDRAGSYFASVNNDLNKYNTKRSNGLSGNRLPLNRMNHHHVVNVNQPSQQSYRQQQQCRYYTQGRCHYGENCKFSHE